MRQAKLFRSALLWEKLSVYMNDQIVILKKPEKEKRWISKKFIH